MIVNCNSCQKKFVVPDSAITESGRLVECGSCGNKWTQYPVKEKPILKTKKSKPIKIKKNKKKINLYSEEYLKKKHGLVIKKSTVHLEKKTKSFGFYGYMITTVIFFIAIFGILNLSRDVLILNYPTTETYINDLYEVIDIIKITFTELVNQFKN